MFTFISIKLFTIKRYYLLVAMLPLVIVACNNKASIPFPADETGFSQPVSKPFKFSEPHPLQWIDISPDSIKPPTTIPLDINKLPSKPFTVNDFKPLKNPIQQKKLDWDNIPDSAINLDTISEKPFRIQKSILPKPIVTKAGIPTLMPNTTSGILQFSENEGLPGSIITASLIDKNGMVWLATNRGLCRYTGDNLFVYSFLNKTPQGSDYSISRIAEDHSGKIWLSTSGDGIYILDIDNGILFHNNIYPYGADIICDHLGMIWLTSYANGLYIINPQKETIKNILPNDKRNEKNLVLSLIEDQYHNIWMGSPGHISILDSSRQKIKKIIRKQGLNINYPINFFEDSKGDMWTSSFAREINFVSLKNKTITTINANNGFTGMGLAFTEDSNGSIWAIQKDTIFIFNQQKNAVKNLIINVKIIDPQTGDRGTFFSDKHGNMWVGSVDKGVLLIDSKGPLPENVDSKNGLIDNNVWGLVEDKNDNIWISTHRGLNIYDPHKNRLLLLSTKQGLGDDDVRRINEFDKDNIFVSTVSGFSIINTLKKTLANYGKEQHLSKYNLMKSVKDDKNQLWLGSLNGIAIYDISKNYLKVINKSTGLLSNTIWDMQVDLHGNFWVGTDSGIVIINPANNTLQYLRESEGLCNNIIQKMVVRKNGEIWVATQKGISIVDPEKYTIINLSAKEGLVPETIYDLVEQNNKLYAGSSDGLIIITKPDSNKIEKNKWNIVNYGKREGFPYNDYNQNTGMAAKNGQTWWGITPVLTIVTQQPAADTIAPNVYLTRITIMDQNPSFVSYKTLNNQLKNNDTLWDVSKKKYYVKNSLPKDSGYLQSNNIEWDSITSLFKLPVGLSLPHNQNAINFSFTNNEIKGREKIVYCYILEGADKKWSDIYVRPSSKNYYNLSPGKYTFKVVTKGFNGLWSKPAELNFTIRSPWWQTWWAFLLYAMLAAFIISTYARYRSRQLQLKNIDLENKIKQRTTELTRSLDDLKSTQAQLVQAEKMASLGELTAGIAHEIQNPLNFVNNFSELNKELLVEMRDEMDKGNMEDAKAIANDVIDNEEKINHHGKRADAIVKGMLEHSRSNSGQKEPTDINALADEYLRLSYHGLRAKDKSFNATMKTDFDDQIGNINIVSQDIGRVLLNLINNAFYAVNEKKKNSALTPEGEKDTAVENYQPTVTLTTQRLNSTSGDGDKVFISVKDNGNGIPQKIVDKIFQPFFTTKPTGQGTGLGLSLSYDIIKAHGGTINVDTGEGKFTEFVIQLPLV